MSPDAQILSCRAAFISDVHLGTRGCQAAMLLDFIRHLECEQLYLVGDIIDGWKLKGGWHWPQSHNDVVQKVLRMARKGVAVTYVPGNHDEGARDFCGVHFGGWWLPGTPSTRPPTAGDSWSSTATSSTASCSTPAGSPSSAIGPIEPFSC